MGTTLRWDNANTLPAAATTAGGVRISEDKNGWRSHNKPGSAVKQHICIIVHDFHDGGSEMMALRLAGEWLRQGRAVTIIAGSPDGRVRERVPPGVTVEVLDPPIPRSRLSLFRLGRGMVPALRKVAPDVLFLPGNFHFIVARAIRRHFPGLPIIAKVSNPLVPRLPGPLRRVAEAVVRLLLLAPIDKLAFISPELLAADSDVIGAARTPAVATVIADPNLPDGYSPPFRHGPQTPPLILAIGRMEPQKNLALAIRAFSALVARQKARLVILGEGRERAALEALVRLQGLDGMVEMPGFVPDVGAMLGQASLLLITSRYEGVPAALIEALAADVPVVSTNCSPSQKALIASPLHGRVVDDATPEHLAEAMAAVLTLPFATGGARAAGLCRHASDVSATRYLALFDSTCR